MSVPTDTNETDSGGQVDCQFRDLGIYNFQCRQMLPIFDRKYVEA